MEKLSVVIMCYKNNKKDFLGQNKRETIQITADRFMWFDNCGDYDKKFH